jgi:hypothetical protein
VYVCVFISISVCACVWRHSRRECVIKTFADPLNTGSKTDRQQDRQTARQADGQTGRQADRHTGIQGDKQTGRQVDK